MTIYTRPVQMLLCGLLLLTLAIAVLNTLVPLWLAHENMPTWQVGMVGSSYFTGNLAGTLLAGWVIKRLGFNRSYYLASLIFAVGCVGLGITVGFWTWLSWRFYRRRRLRDDLGGGGKRAGLQRHFPQSRSSAGGVHDGLLRRYRTGPADGQ
ncbi:Hypothetical MFS-type transporter protein YcaD [Klebsiella pneumoniae IS53]|nr:Hypothetical MFS-type transporter protein YcaD [Klebsiella pneumoniae IS53]CDL62420.1 Hypothetical MFS-type transporter protein YcaD [Klebsiella pneumoniae IS39]